MALSARPVTTGATPSVPTGHIGGGGRNVASVALAQIEEIISKTGVQPDANFMGFANSGDRSPNPRPEQPRNVGGRFDTPSAIFVGLLAQEQASGDMTRGKDALKGMFRSVLGKAISAYEGTSAVIHGTRTPRGASLSISM